MASDRWPDLSPDGLQRREKDDQKVLASLGAIPREDLSEEERTVVDLFSWQLDRRLAQFRLRMYLTPFWDDYRFAPNGGVLAAPSELWLPPATTVAALGERVRKLQAFPAYLQQAGALLFEAEKTGMMPSKELVGPFVLRASALLGVRLIVFDPRKQESGPTPIEDTIVRSLGSLNGIPPADRDRILHEVRTVVREKIVPALVTYVDVLSNQYLRGCPESRSLSAWPSGAAIYRELTRRYTTTDMGPGQIHEFGLKEVARIRAKMLAVIARTGFKGSLDQFFTFVRTDPRFYFSTQDELLDAYRKALDRVKSLTPEVVHPLPSVSLSVERGAGDSAAAMFRPPDRRGEEGVIYVSLLNPKIHPKFEIIPLMLHEGLPGHALQNAFADESRARPSDLLAEVEWRSGQMAAFQEGWGLYSESLGEDMGAYGDPYDEFGELRMELTRAVRLVIDTGIHLNNWSESRAEEYFESQTGKPREEVEGEVARTLWPGSQLAYKIGQQEFQQMRELARTKLGKDFDLGRFDSAVLRWGPLPFDVAKRKLSDCLEARDCTAANFLNSGVQ